MDTGFHYIDTHVHLYDEAFDADLEETLLRMRRAGVKYCIFPAIDKESYSRQSTVAQKCRGYAFEAIGLHPTSVGNNWQDELDFVEQQLVMRINDNPYVAIGEIGIDGYWSKEFIEEQKIVFKHQLLLAHKYNLPVIVHVRDAIEEIFEVLDSLDAGIGIKGVFHAFSGSYETYCRLKRYGDIKVGIGGVVTYKNAGIAKVLEQIPLEDILLETDAPWLTPVPYRGKRNESTYLTVIAEKIANIKGCTLDEVAATTTANAMKLFNIN